MATARLCEVEIYCESFGDRSGPAARLVMIDGIGHSLPVQLWERIAGGFSANVVRAGAGGAGS
ncbi:MAG: hypothetical protein M0Z69_02115 [Actinomycetota bacterium]|nr:hypothetical protein [Actinomycetota bacterium]